MRSLVVFLLAAACAHTVAVRSVSNVSCVETCKRFATGDEIACAQRCPGAVVGDKDCTPTEKGCVSDEEMSSAGRVGIAFGTGAALVAGLVLSGILVYVIVTAV